MDETEFVNLVEDTLEVSPGTVSLTDNLIAIDWDSLANIGFIAALDSSYGAVVNAEALSQCESVQDLFDLAQSAIRAK